MSRFPQLLKLSLAIPILANAATVETYVLATGGQAYPVFSNPPQFACSVSGPTAPKQAHGLIGGAGIPTEGFANCGIAGGYHHLTSTGPLSDTTSLTTSSFLNDSRTFVGVASAAGNYGLLGSKAHGTLTGDPTNGSTHAYAESFAYFDDALAFLSPAVSIGSSGTVTYYFSVDGSMSRSGYGEALQQIYYRQGSGPNYLLMNAAVRGGGSPSNSLICLACAGGVAPGFTITDTSISGAGVMPTLALPITFGTPGDVSLLLYSFSAPASQPGTPGVYDTNFYSTARLTGIEVRDEAGNLVPFTVQSASGTLYDAGGVHLNAVPEPATLAYVSASLIALAALLARRRFMFRPYRGERVRLFMALAALAMACGLPAEASPGLSTYANTVAGQSQLGAAGPPLSCTTSGPTAQVRSNFPSGSIPAVGFPADAGCGVQQNLNQQAGITGLVTTGSALNRKFMIDGVTSVNFNGSSQSRANYFNVGATAAVTYSGTSNNLTFIGSESFAISRETLTIPGPPGQPGTFRATIALDGSMTATGPGSAHLIFSYNKDNGPQFTPVRFDVDPRLGAPTAFVINQWRPKRFDQRLFRIRPARLIVNDKPNAIELP
ncbi:MAG: hypothetical protein ACKV22_31185 [Bryobacteraceae bacterium]